MRVSLTGEMAVQPNNLSDVCGRCGLASHQIKNCTKPNNEGVVEGCRICNVVDHNLVTCPVPNAASKRTLYHYLVVERTNRPPAKYPLELSDLFGARPYYHKGPMSEEEALAIEKASLFDDMPYEDPGADAVEETSPVRKRPKTSNSLEIVQRRDVDRLPAEGTPGMTPQASGLPFSVVDIKGLRAQGLSEISFTTMKFGLMPPVRPDLIRSSAFASNQTHEASV
jgi:hypothetical protein